MKQNQLISYAYSFISFLLRNAREELINNISRIILFGSTVIGTFTKNSDVDLFIELIEENEKDQEELEKFKEEFKKSLVYKKLWKLLGITNDISLTIGKLKDFPSLKESMEKYSITLFQRGIFEKGGEEAYIVFWKTTEKAKYMKLKRYLFGYEKGGKIYKGKINFKIAGKNFIIVNKTNFWEIYNFLKKNKIEFNFRKIFV